jgi:uncharacterized protein YabE (DUF348 family)
MKVSLRNSTASFKVSAVIAGAVLFLILIFALIVTRVGAADTVHHAGRLITIHDRGTEKIILSNSDTIAAALEEAGVSVDPRDAVEPALDEKLVASEYQVNIYRARPVVIIDGALRHKVITPYQTGAQIVKDAGIALNPEDQTILKRSSDLVGDGAGLQLTIDRATPITIVLYGTKTEARTQATTVGEMLQEKNIQLGTNGRASLDASTPITAGMEITIWREGRQTLNVEESIPFSTEQIRDADREVGYKAVQTVGQNGTRTATYEIEIKDGKEVSRTEIASIVTTEPIKQVETIGIKAKLLVNYSSDKAAIMTAAGIAPEDQGYAAYIINNENAAWCAIRWQGTPGCWAEYAEKFPGAEGSSQVGYGLCQATPGNKMATAGADWRTNVVTQMKWCHGYAIGRYGSWEKAYNFKVSRGWW